MNQMNLEKPLKIKAIHFPKIAQHLLNEIQLIVNGKEYRLMEIEFYLHTDEHPDEYTHRHPLQAQWGQWYFHRVKPTLESGFKGGTFKGLDITLGKIGYRFCGVLIRSILRMNDNTLITGPCNCVNEILKVCDCESIQQFVADQELNVFKCPLMHLLPMNNNQQQLYQSARIGLSAKYPDYANRLYRFTSTNKKVKACSTLVAV